MFKKEINYIDKIALLKCIDMYKDSYTNEHKNIDSMNDISFINIIGVGQLGKYFIDYCNDNNRWNDDNSIFINTIDNAVVKEKMQKISNKLSFSTLDDYIIMEHHDDDINMFLFNLSELGEFDKFINKVNKIKCPYSVIFGVRTKHSRLQFDIIENSLSKDTKLPIVIIDEEKLLEETNNYIIYELYNLARNFMKN
ncbi:hypothetical protein [Clostridium sp.]|uniref:hypothetical protein n=1 Tax=Clostridium sp. TaxID=1506 RepID=UPI002FCA26DA